MIHETSVTPSDCPALKGMELLERKWILQILHALAGGRARFCALQDSIGELNSVTLSRRLKLLEAQKIVTREVIHELPPWVEYELTEMGVDLIKVIEAIEVWCDTWDTAGAEVAASPVSVS
ncbi:MAG: helix-turn-helix transcriptional regulator [Chloroflexi bacterium]|nr:helix-turn-helix transcriptional regulator [Chloroflexota bacterium]